LLLEHLLLGGGEHGVERPQHREGKNHLLVLAALERVADEIRDAPQEANDFAVVH